ncbi:MAG: hypothetical protein A2Z66_03545 [Chloroflexi bacterium RBG_13_66_10]|nr:MAG: hypothetical protein A2Z66_03545 [Chloroflexi bacterium RBG_13_66_10]
MTGQGAAREHERHEHEEGERGAITRHGSQRTMIEEGGQTRQSRGRARGCGGRLRHEAVGPSPPAEMSLSGHDPAAGGAGIGSSGTTRSRIK